MPEVGLSGLFLDYPHSGTAVYTRNLVANLPAVAGDLRFRLFVRHAALAAAGVETQRVTMPFGRLTRRGGSGARLDKLLWESLALPLAAAAHREALLHSLYFAVPPVSRVPVVVTVHDLIPLAVPGYHRSRQSAAYSRLMATTARHASAIIAVSHHGAQDIERLLGVPPNRVHVTHEATDDRFAPGGLPDEVAHLHQKYRLPERFVLYLGSAERRKNLETLVRAWSSVAGPMRDRDVRLLIVARFPPPDALYPDIPALVRELRLERDVCFLDNVEECDKPALYRASLAFAFPSVYEGFGLPPLEAMACGVPVVASDATSIPEVVGNGGWLLPPFDAPAWAEALVALADSETKREELRTRGLRRAADFSWRRTAEETISVYREVLGA